MNFERGRIESGPFIILPKDAELMGMLQEKLKEYEGRRRGSFKSPEQQMDSICKTEILGALLKYGKVNTEEIKEGLMNEYGSGFNERIFANACGVIRSYAEAGGAGLTGGTGL